MGIVGKGAPEKVKVDSWEIFTMWSTLGSLRKVQAELERRGLINPETNRPYCQNNIRIRAIRGVCESRENVDKAYDYFVANGMELSREEYYTWVIGWVKNVVTWWGKYPNTLYYWVRKMGLKEYLPEKDRPLNSIDEAKVLVEKYKTELEAVKAQMATLEAGIAAEGA